MRIKGGSLEFDVEEVGVKGEAGVMRKIEDYSAGVSKTVRKSQRLADTKSILINDQEIRSSM